MIPMPFYSLQFVHFGNALVVVGCLLFGTKNAALPAAIYPDLAYLLITRIPSVVWGTILESYRLLSYPSCILRKAMNKDDQNANVIVVSVVAALSYPQYH